MFTYKDENGRRRPAYKKMSAQRNTVQQLMVKILNTIAVKVLANLPKVSVTQVQYQFIDLVKITYRSANFLNFAYLS